MSRTEQDRLLLQFDSGFAQGQDLFNHIVRLLGFIEARDEIRLIPLSSIRPKRLAMPFRCLSDDSIGGFENWLGRTVILFQR